MQREHAGSAGQGVGTIRHNDCDSDAACVVVIVDSMAHRSGDRWTEQHA